MTKYLLHLMYNVAAALRTVDSVVCVCCHHQGNYGRQMYMVAPLQTVHGQPSAQQSVYACHECLNKPWVKAA